MIPSWLAEESATSRPVSGGRKRRGSILEKTLRAASGFVEEAFFSETSLGRTNLSQYLDPRTVLFAVLALILVISCARSPWTVWGIYLLATLMALFAGIVTRPAIMRNWLVVPLVATVIALPALCNVIVPGDPLWVVARLGESPAFGHWHFPAEITITRQGMRFAALFVGRVAASTALAALLTLTVPWNLLLQSLRLCRVPQLLVLVLAMTYRYLALLIRATADMHLARKSRTVRYVSAGAERLWVAARLGYLFSRSYRLSLEVHDAMVARGFTGESKALKALRIRGRDVAAALLVLLFCTALLLADRML